MLREEVMRGLGQIVFDMDGTLVDAMPQHAMIFAQILFEAYSIPLELSQKLYYDTAGHPLDDQVQLAVKEALGIEVLDCDALIDLFWASIANIEPVLFPNTRSTLDRLVSVGYDLFVFSGCAPFIVDMKMERAGLSNCFKMMLGTDRKIPCMTKGEGHLSLIYKRLGYCAEEFRRSTLIVGDAEHDIAIAKAMNMTSVGIVGTTDRETLLKAGSTFVIEDISELIPILSCGRDYRRIIDIGR